MKVYACPDECQFPEPDYSNYNPDNERKREEEHQLKLKQWLADAGYTGPYTGEIYSTPRADGYANYMIGDKGRSGILIHLPYGDGWDSPDVEYLPKAEIIKRIKQRKSWPTR
jgi:hypothetical protein